MSCQRGSHVLVGGSKPPQQRDGRGPVVLDQRVLERAHQPRLPVGDGGRAIGGCLGEPAGSVS
jgi:hypothetical protein